LLIHQSSATEGNPAALEDEILDLVQLIKNRDADLCHVNRGEWTD